MKKKVIALIAVAALSVSVLTGCGSNETAAQTSEAAATTANQETTAQTTEATESKEVADTDTTIKVAASAVPHAEILEAAQVPRTLPEVSFGVLNGNYAMEAGLTVADDALLYESDDSEAAATYVNVIAVKEGNENLPKIKALVDTLKSDEIKQFINDNYNGGVIPYK